LFGIRTLKRIFDRKREEIAGGWKRLHNEEFHNLYTSLNIIKGKGKVVSVLLTEHHARKSYWGNGGIAPLIL
jgi:hypothetical protein